MPSTMPSSPLLGRLPNEIRDEIFGLLLTVPEEIVLDLAGRFADEPNRVRAVLDARRQPFARLLRVDKATYFSALPILYGTNTFTARHTPAVLSHFVVRLGDGKKYLKQLGLHSSCQLPDLYVLGKVLRSLGRPTILHVKMIDTNHWPMATPEQMAYCMRPWIKRLVKQEGSLAEADKRVLRLIRAYPTEMGWERDIEALDYSCAVKQELKRLLKIETEEDPNFFV